MYLNTMLHIIIVQMSMKIYEKPTYTRMSMNIYIYIYIYIYIIMVLNYQKLLQLYIGRNTY